MEPQETTQTVPETTPKNQQPTNVIAAIATCIAMIAIAVVIILHSTGKTGQSPSAAAADTGNAAPATTPAPADVATLRPSDANYIRGNADTAQVLIFEYSDSDCPFCEKFHPTLEQVVNDYKGKVAWVYRFFPLDSLHPNAFNEALALSCAGQLGGPKAFDSYLDSIINITVSPDAKSNEILTTVATQQGIDATKFKACIAAPATTAAVTASVSEAEAIGAQGTPYSIIVNKNTGKQVIIPGAYPLADVEKAIDSLLK